MIIFARYLFVASIDLCNRNDEACHSGSRVPDGFCYGQGVCMIVIVQESMTAMSLVEHQIA